MKLNFGREALVLPGSLATVCTEADAIQLRVLICLASDLSLADSTAKLARLAGCDVRAARAAIAFWTTEGVLVADGAAEVSPTDEAPRNAPRITVQRTTRAPETVPVYSSTEIADLLEAREGMRALVDEAQNILGKMLTPADLNVLVGMVDYLNMDVACILLLLAHCKRIGKTQLRSIEKYAISLSDKGIVEPVALDEYIREFEALHTLENEVRKMFGLKSRALSEKEKRMLKRWHEFGYGEEIIRRAFEVTVNSTGDASLSYANAILERWNSEGLHTAEAIDASLAAESEKKSGSVSVGSFETDDYFEAALRRSFRENDTPT